MAVYTRTGDKGETSLADGSRVDKSSQVFSLVGALDELNSRLGMCLVALNFLPPEKQDLFQKERALLVKLQKDLFTVGAVVAKASVKFDFVKETKMLESLIDDYEKELPRLTEFILPGGSEFAGWLHLARVQARKVERMVVGNRQLVKKKAVLPYFNRLSDLLFTLARWANFRLKKEELGTRN